MRRSYDPEFLSDENGTFYGICLGADFCAEHEWGINGLRQDFGIGDDTKLGAEKSKTTSVPEDGFGFFDLTNGAILSKYNTICHHDVKDIIRTSEFRKKEKLECAWDRDSFSIYVDKAHKGYLKQLYDAFCNKDVCVLSSQLFLKSGLVFCIYSKLPEKLKKELIEKDESNIRLKKAAEETGIVDYLNKHGFKEHNYPGPGWMALTPAWKRGKEEIKKNIIFWLNPTQQHLHNYGWFTVHELKQWVHGKGPIPKTKKQLRKNKN